MFTKAKAPLARLFGTLLSPVPRPQAWARASTEPVTNTRAYAGKSAGQGKGGGGGVFFKSSSSSSSTKSKSKKGRRGAPVLTESGKKVRTLRMNMFAPAPPPLRMARNRYLRHWTIHRAWQLFRRQQNEATHRERSRMYAGMFNACEALRQTSGPGDRTEGYLYRVAMEKKGLWHGDAVPIEYGRLQTETPATEAWNHDWKR